MKETPASLVAKSKTKQFNIGRRTFVSQEPFALKEEFRNHSVVSYLPQFVLIWNAIELATGHAWKCTSYIRNSPSHRRGQAFDLAPDIAASAYKQYAVNNNSDPVLYKRTKLIEQLQSIKDHDFSGNGSNSMGIFIEPDHLHIQVLKALGPAESPTRVIKWKQPKPVYADTQQRMDLPEYL